MFPFSFLDCLSGTLFPSPVVGTFGMTALQVGGVSYLGITAHLVPRPQGYTFSGCYFLVLGSSEWVVVEGTRSRGK